MTAGSGIIHQEMPRGDSIGRMYGFQLWANLPQKNKMMQPRYRDVKSGDIPSVTLSDGIAIKIIAGEVNGVSGPVKDIVIDPEYLDITVPQNRSFTHPVKTGYQVFVYVIEGSAGFEVSNTKEYGNRTLLLFDDGDELSVTTTSSSVRFLLVSGKPLNEPIAWGGPIVMNTQDELNLAFRELEEGKFIK
jgi:hypothetical protein